MKKLIALLFALVLLTAACAATAQTNSLLGKAMPDFKVTTIDGETLTLSGLLEEKELVILNIFTSWCTPCAYEFPELESVYEALSDRIEIVALSHEPSDTAELLAQYREALGLTFPIGSATGTGVDRFIGIQGYPTTVMINREGVVSFFQLGAFAAGFQVEAIASHFLDPDYDGGPAAFYGLYMIDQNGDFVPGVVVNYCTDTACLPCVSDENGLIMFVGKPDVYHLQILKAPEGYSFDPDFEYTTDEAGGIWLPVNLTKE